ncbi:MAG: hypothetical protein PHO66_04745 [Eubacteriales bacterium]|nr:hypothetical protein [Eubacteriales bacterium]
MKDKNTTADKPVAQPAQQTPDETARPDNDRTAAFVEDVSAQLAQLMDIGLVKDPAEFSQAIQSDPALLQRLLDGDTVLEALGEAFLANRQEEARQEGLKLRKARNTTVPTPIKAAAGTTAIDPANFTAGEMKSIEEKLNRGEKVYLG